MAASSRQPGKYDERDASDGGADRIGRNGLSCAYGSVQASLFLLLSFVFFNERGAGRQDRGERQK